MELTWGSPRVSAEAALFVREAVRGKARCDLVHTGSPPGLVVAARVHRVQGYVVRALREGPGRAEAQLGELLRDYTLAAALHARAQATLADVSRIFHGAGIPWLTVKGPVLTEQLHGGAGMRTYGDLDVVVAPVDLGPTLDVLEAAGAVPEPRSWRHVHEEIAGELPVRMANGQVVDLHWHLVNAAGVRRAFAIDTGPLVERGVAVPFGGGTARTTDPVDTLLHLCLHATISGGNRLLWLKDIELAVRAVDGRWDEVVARAARWRVGLVVGVMLVRVRDVLGLELPEGLEATLVAGSAWIPVTRLAQRALPLERSVAPASLDRMIVRATSSTSASSWGRLARKVAKGVATRMMPVEQDRVAPGPDDASWRAAFLEAVAAG